MVGEAQAVGVPSIEQVGVTSVPVVDQVTVGSETLAPAEGEVILTVGVALYTLT